jgi:hypothetical protein
MPRVGGRARIAHFGGGFQDALIVRVQDGGRRVLVRDESGELLEFALSPATARFMATGPGHGPRLELLGER